MADEHAYDFSGTINVPFWHQNLVLAILSSLGILGIFLNGFVICCFILQPMVSKDLFRNTDLLICILLILEKHLISSISCLLFLLLLNVSFSTIFYKMFFTDSYPVQLFAHKSSDSRISLSICGSSIWYSSSHTSWLAVWSECLYWNRRFDNNFWYAFLG